jgi:DNA processing protein
MNPVTTANSRPAAISPFREMGAYEALWTERGASFKRISLRFKARDRAIPSDFVLPNIAERMAREAIGILREAGIDRFGVRIHRAGDYPQRLRAAEYPVELLYFRGWWDLIETRLVAIVGTRHPSEEGKQRAAELARSLVLDKFTIVSGLAAGIDTVAHRTAIEFGGWTIGVLGTALHHSYPAENSDLQRIIAEEYLLISQVPIVQYSRWSPRTNRFFFPQRNITMSALTEATIIVEASDTSGTLIQARAAVAQGRKLFVLDSCFANPSITWPGRFEAMGAMRVKDYSDIRKHLA